MYCAGSASPPSNRVTGNGLAVPSFRSRFRFLPLGLGNSGAVSPCMQCSAWLLLTAN